MIQLCMDIYFISIEFHFTFIELYLLKMQETIILQLSGVVTRSNIDAY